MEQTFIIPEGYEFKQTGENQFSIVKKCEPTKYEETPGDFSAVQEKQMREVVERRKNSFFTEVENRNDYDFDEEPRGMIEMDCGNKDMVAI